jgi:pseudomonalisin
MSRRLLAAAGAAAVAAGLVTGPLAATGSASTSPAGWAATGTRALHLKGTDLGAAPANQRLDISVTLPLRNRAEINRLIVSMATPGSRNYERYLTPRQVAARFGPTRSEVSAVERYLTTRGFRSVSAASNRLLVSGQATVAQAERAFHTRITDYRLNGHVVYANTAAALVPTALHADVAAVLGLSDVPMNLPLVVHRAKPSTPTAGSPDLSGFTPRAIQHAYDAASMPAAKSTSIAIISSGDETPVIRNLRYAEKVEHFPKVRVSVVYDGPKSGIIYGNPLTGNLEWDLDTQISTMVAQSVKHLYIYDVLTFTDPEVARGINMFVAQDKAQALSASLGECDYIAWVDGAMLTTDESLAEGGLQGQSAFASTGDNGYACPEVASTGIPEGPPGDSWPADGEYTTGVGGTTLLASSSGKVQNEIAWIGGGGGISPYETAAPWTLPANGAGQVWQYSNQGGRSVPDVAADADPNTGVLIYGGGKTPTDVGGTSVSSPLTMGLWARMENVRHNELGLAQYDFYCYYDKVNPATIVQSPVGPVYIPAANPKPVPGFRDIVLGTNGVYFAKPGYDYTSGIGSVQARLLAQKLKRHGA